MCYIISLRLEIWIYKTSVMLPCPFFLFSKVYVPGQRSEWSYICVLGVSILPLCPRCSNKISVLFWRYVGFFSLFYHFYQVGETGVPRENHRPAVSLWYTFITQCWIEYTIQTDNVSGEGTICIYRCKFIYHTITTSPILPL
jgi:hypothetical protein